jgi:hypothetical protein
MPAGEAHLEGSVKMQVKHDDEEYIVRQWQHRNNN